jgi:hypothetical protein
MSLITLTDGGMAMNWSDVHPQNTLNPISSSPLPRPTAIIREQQWNAIILIVLMDGGIMMWWSDLQY